jgi:hypothetical protein
LRDLLGKIKTFNWKGKFHNEDTDTYFFTKSNFRNILNIIDDIKLTKEYPKKLFDSS